MGTDGVHYRCILVCTCLLEGNKGNNTAVVVISAGHLQQCHSTGRKEGRKDGGREANTLLKRETASSLTAFRFASIVPAASGQHDHENNANGRRRPYACTHLMDVEL